jgi:predicted RNase H-like HicB family nuclease
MEWMKFTVILGPENDGGYSVFCPALPGCVSQGDSLDDALSNIHEAILGWLEVATDAGEGVPAETPDVVAEEIESVLKDRAEDGLPLTIETREIEIEAEVAA